MNRKENIKLKIVLTILLGCGAIFIFLYSLNVVQNSMVMDQVQKEMSRDITKLMDNYDTADAQHVSIRESIDTVYEQNLLLLIRMIQEDPDAADLGQYLERENGFFEYADIMIVDKDGNITESANGLYKDLKDEQYDPLREVFQSKELELVKVEPLTEADVWRMAEGLESLEDIDLADLQYNGLYACRMDEDKELVLAIDMRADLLCTMQLNPWFVLLQNEIIGEQGYVFVWSDDEEEILYYPDKEFQYCDLEKLGMNMDKIKDGTFGWNEINGEKMYLYPVHQEELGVWIACAVSKSELIHSRRVTTLVQWALFAMLAAALVYYVTLLLRQNKIKVLTDFTGSGRVYAHQSRQHKLFIITILISLILALVVFYLQTLYLLSTWAGSSTRQTQRIEETVYAAGSGGHIPSRIR